MNLHSIIPTILIKQASAGLVKVAAGNRALRKALELAKENPDIISRLLKNKNLDSSFGNLKSFDGITRKNFSTPLANIGNAFKYGIKDKQKYPRLNTLIDKKFPDIKAGNNSGRTLAFEEKIRDLQKNNLNTGKSLPKFLRNSAEKKRNLFVPFDDEVTLENVTNKADFRISRRRAIPVKDLPYNPQEYMWRGQKSPFIDPTIPNQFLSGLAPIAAGHAGYTGHGGFIFRVKPHRTLEKVKPQLEQVAENIDLAKPFYTTHVAESHPGTRLYLHKKNLINSANSVDVASFDPKIVMSNASTLERKKIPTYETVYNFDKQIPANFLLEGDTAIPIHYKPNAEIRKAITRGFTPGSSSSLVPFTRPQLDAILNSENPQTANSLIKKFLADVQDNAPVSSRLEKWKKNKS
jgi:hypothetical protein